MKLILIWIVLCLCCKNSYASDMTRYKILVVGDSLSAQTKFATGMVDFLRNPKLSCQSAQSEANEVFYYSLVSSSPRHWGDSDSSNKKWLCRQKKIYGNGTQKDTSGKEICSNASGISIFEKLLDRHNPEIVILQLGTNSFGFASKYFKGKINQMLQSIPDGTKCFWIGPTRVASKYLQDAIDTEADIRDSLTAELRIKCQPVESLTAMQEQSDCKQFNVKDGIHHTQCGSRVWGAFASEELCLSGEF